jgi:hypothetical protein
MKLVFVLAVALLAGINCMDLAQQKAMLMGIAQECKVTEDASDADMGLLLEKKPPVTKEGKCVFACIIENMDIVMKTTF